MRTSYKGLGVKPVVRCVLVVHWKELVQWLVYSNRVNAIEVDTPLYMDFKTLNLGSVNIIIMDGSSCVNWYTCLKLTPLVLHVYVIPAVRGIWILI